MVTCPNNNSSSLCSCSKEHHEYHSDIGNIGMALLGYFFAILSILMKLEQVVDIC